MSRYRRQRFRRVWQADTGQYVYKARYPGDDHEPDDDGVSLFQSGARPAQIEDFYPYEVPLGTDFYCLPPGLRRKERKTAW